MLSPAASNKAPPYLDPQLGLMFTAADHLIPLFKSSSIDLRLAREMAVSAIEAYEPQTRADYVNAARTIAFSMAALALLGSTVSQDMAMPEKMRAFGRANALNRSADQSERTMMQRRRQNANTPAEQTGHSSKAHAPEAEITDLEMQAAIAGAMQEYQAACTSATGAAAPETRPGAAPDVPKTPAPGPARVIDPAQPAAVIRHGVPGSDAAQVRPTSYKAGLLNQSAMQRVVGQSAARHSG